MEQELAHSEMPAPAPGLQIDDLLVGAFGVVETVLQFIGIRETIMRLHIPAIERDCTLELSHRFVVLAGQPVKAAER